MQNKHAISYKEATGVIQYNMTNDYMFRYILQKNKKVLKGLICALLHFRPEQIKKVEIKNPRIYNDKFKLSVVDLTQIELATEEDKAFQIDYWARLFKAETWEEIKMLVEKNEYLEAAAESVYVANADEIVRQKCRAREEAERHERTLKRDMERLQEDNKQLKEDKAVLQGENVTLQDKNVALLETNAKLLARIAELEGKKN